MIWFLFFIFSVFTGVDSSVSYHDQVEIPGHEGQCYEEGSKIFYNKGDIIRNEGSECIQKKCLGFVEERGKVSIETLTCPAVEAGPGCSVIQDPNKPYPECCPRLVFAPSAAPKICENQIKEATSSI